MQTACAGADLPGGPVLAIIEDETGAGKTEAAMILAQRMLLAGKGAGLFLALPTMATADAMFARAGAVVGRMFDSPSVALAHGRSALSEAFRDVVGHAAREGEVTCAPWLADGRRKALLAHVGVGTVDQALLGVLPTRFATLRLWGLASKILIVDEVHEMGNPYMAQELQRLLEFHAGRGGSAILLTATLPLAQRQRLVDSFALGRAGHKPDVAQPDYPALTIVGADAVTKPVPALRANRGPVTVRRLGDAEAALDCLIRATGQGAACVWVRNAVDDAISVADALAARGVSVDLLHARLALCDRKHHEAAMLARFGKGGTDRAGRVLVATQVVESSLDLDFDVMVSDLAPMAALIQRAGRLWRHMDRRPADTRPAPEPVLHVLSPDPGAVSDDRWLQGVLDKGAWVYDLVECWRTARVLLRDGRIDAPGGLRDLIEAVHGAGAEPVPEAFSGAETEAEGNRYAEANRGWQNAMTWQDGYRNAGAGHSDTLYPTRLGAEQRVLVLARADGTGGLTPWAGGAGPEAWMLSEVQASAKRLGALPLPAQDTPAIRMATADWPEWKRDSVILCPVGEDGEICEGLSYTRERGLLFLS
nr:CRISPR-associated helicase Cas3' [Boseongicola sp. H5]